MVLACLERIWDVSWVRLGASGDCLGVSWERFGKFWGAFEASGSILHVFYDSRSMLAKFLVRLRLSNHLGLMFRTVIALRSLQNIKTKENCIFENQFFCTYILIHLSTYILIYSCTHILIYSYTHIPTSSHPHIRISSCLHIPISTYPRALKSSYPHRLIFPLPHVHISA